MSPQARDKIDDAGNALWRLVDPRMPLPWLIAAIIVASGVFYEVQGLKSALVSLQIEVKAGNQSWATLAGQQELQKFRQGTTEDEIKLLKAAVTTLQQQNRR